MQLVLFLITAVWFALGVCCVDNKWSVAPHNTVLIFAGFLSRLSVQSGCGMCFVTYG